MKLSEILPTQKNFKLLQTGEPGSGKSVRACSAIRFGRVLVIDTDRKFIGLVPRLREKFGEALVNERIEVEVVNNAAEFKTLMEKLPELAKGFQTVVLDTQSRAFDMVLDNARALNPKLDGRAIFGIALSVNMEYLNRLLGLPQNVIINAHVGSEEMADGTSKLTSTTPGKFGKKMTEFFNEVHYLFISPPRKHSVQGEPSATVVARTVLPKTLINDLTGTFKIDDLSIFDAIALKV